MLTKLKELSTQAKVAIGAGLAALLAIGIGVAVWQPWNQAEEPPKEPDTQQQEPAAPQEPEEKGLSVKVGGEEVPCTLYEGTGWTIYVPEGWTVTPMTGENGAVFSPPEGAEMSLEFRQVDAGTGTFASLSAVGSAGKQLQFCAAGGDGSPVITGRADNAQWDWYEKLFTALAKTLTVGADTPFGGSLVTPWEPDWQTADGYTVLFLDKDGVILDEDVQAAVEDFMRSWPEEDRALYTGQYRVSGIDWAASYMGLAADRYIDVFRARVQYRVAADSEDAVKDREGVTVVDGWATLPHTVYLGLTHDGGNVEKTKMIVTPDAEDWVLFADNLIG